MKSTIASRWGSQLIAAAVVFLVRGIFLTVRRVRQLAVPNTDPFEPTCAHTYLYSVWHDAILLAAFFRRHRRMAALSSLHRDGTQVATVLRRLNMSMIQGSTSRITSGAMRALLRCLTTHHLAITPDGPRGPRRQMSQGLAYLASRTGRPILPSGFACSRAWRIQGSWTDLVIPKPFSRVVLVIGSPIHVPRDISARELAEWVSTIQAAMDDAQQAAESMAGCPQAMHAPKSPRAAA